MRKFFGLAFLILFCAAPDFAQTTIVSGQVKDPASIPYAFAQLTAQLTINGTNVTGQPVVTVSNQAQCISAGMGNAPCKIPFQGTAGPVTLDQSGNIPGGGMTLQDNTLVTPAGTQWTFNVTTTGQAPPIGTGPQRFSVSITISGSSQNIGSTLSAAAPSLVLVTGPAVSPLNTFTFSKACAPNDPLCFQVADNGQAILDAGMTAASGTITSSGGDPPFSPSDVGKIEEGFFNCSNLNEDLCHSNCAPGTITAFVNAHQVTVSPVCANNSTGGSSNNFIWGTDDCTPLTNGYQAALAQTSFTTAALNFPGGMMLETCPALQDPVGLLRAFPLKFYGHGTTIVPMQNMACNVASITSDGCFLSMHFGNDQLGQVGDADVAYDLLFWCGGSDVPGTGTYSNPSDGIFVTILGALVNVGVQGCNWNKSTAAPFYAGSLNGGSWFNPMVNGVNFGVHLANFNGEGAHLYGGTMGGGFGNAAVCDSGTATAVGSDRVYYNQSAGPNFASKFAYGIRNSGCIFNDNASTDVNVWSDSATGVTNLNNSQISGFGAINDLSMSLGRINLIGAHLSGNLSLTGGTLFVDANSTWPPPSGFSPAAPSGVVMLSGNQLGSDFQLAKTTAQAAKTVYTVGGNTESFRVTITIGCTTASAAATVTPSIIFTDTSNTAVTITGAGGQVATCTALGTASNATFSVTIRAKNATAIQYSTAIANTPTYDITVGVEPASLF